MRADLIGIHARINESGAASDQNDRERESGREFDLQMAVYCIRLTAMKYRFIAAAIP